METLTTKSSSITGVHHVTAFAGGPKQTHDFYTHTLGMRMVKKTVNFDDPFTYHLYFADEQGTPGTLLTHFPHPQARRGAPESGPEIADIVLSTADLSAWRKRFQSTGVETKTTEMFGQEALAFSDQDGMRYQLLAEKHPSSNGYTGGTVTSSPIEGVSGIVLAVPNVDETARFLEQHLGFTQRASQTGVDAVELYVGENAPGQRVLVKRSASSRRARMGAGSVHHVAWRVPNDAAHRALQASLATAGVGVTPVIDRSYFHSIYFQIPGGLIFEVATDNPGFTTDEPLAHLGEGLMLPPQHEHLRSELERSLEPLGS